MNPESTSGWWARFSARYDSVLLAPPQDTAAPAAALAHAGELAQTLGDLCKWGPALAVVEQAAARDPQQRAAQQVWLQRQMLQLDGTLHMQQLGGPWRQRLHRLTIKWQESTRGAASAGPWDCGWLQTGPAALAQAVHFRPRRPTLMVAWGLAPVTVNALCAAFQQSQAHYQHPVRLWVLATEAPLA